MDHSKELPEFERGTITGSHCCKKLVPEISFLLDIPQSTVSGITDKWKRFGTTSTQPRSVCKVTEQVTDCWGTKCIKVTNALLTQQLQNSKPPVASTSAQKLCSGSFMQCFHGQVAACKPYINKHNAKRQMECVKHAAAGLWSSENVFCGVMNLAVWWTSLGLANARRMLPAWLHCANCKVWWRRDDAMGLFFRGWSRTLSSSEGKS